MRILCLVNPNSGAGRGLTIIHELRALFSSGAVEGEVLAMEPSNITDQVGYGHTFDRLLVAGGDGAVSLVLPYLVNTTLPLGVIPLGTGNDLAREVGLTRWIDAPRLHELVCKYRDASATPFCIGAMTARDHDRTFYFSNYVSFGFDALIVEEFSHRRAAPAGKSQRHRIRNRLKYAALALRHLPTARTPILELRGDDAFTYRTEATTRSIILANIQSYMGLGLTNLTGLWHDDLFELIVARSALDYARMILRRPRKALATARCWEIFDTSGLVPVQIDGEPIVTKSRAYEIKKGGEILLLRI